jgi:hypothetical protein
VWQRSPPPPYPGMTGMLVLMMVQWGALTAWLVRSKRRNLAGWFAIGAVLPVIGVGVALAMPVKTPRARTKHEVVRRPVPVHAAA